MQSRLSILGLICVIVGVFLLAYQGFTYTKHETVAQLGDLKVTADTRENVYLSPVVGGAVLAFGIVLIVLGRRNSQ